MYKSTVLVVGADGMVGGALLNRLKLSGIPVLGTIRRPDQRNDNLYLDLLSSDESWVFPDSIGVAVICAGNRKVNECQENPEKTAQVNVDGRCRLIKILVEKNVFVIFLSTSAVFDGSVSQRMPYDQLSPITEYGLQNAEVEQNIGQYGDSIAIVRGTKFLGPNFTLFDEWRASLISGRAINPFKNMSMAPIPLTCITSVLHLLCQVRKSGIWQVSGSRDISYVEAAQIGTSLLQTDPKLVQPIDAPFARHSNESLNMDRIRSILGVEPPDVDWLVKRAFLDPLVLIGK